MSILDLLQVDACLCITTFREERFHNMIQIKKDLNIPIKFIQPIQDDDPSLSYGKTYVKVLREYKEKNQKILIFEDDIFTDLTSDEIENFLKISNTGLLNYDILSLGSQSYIKEEFNNHFYKVKAFGYSHSICFNLKTLSNEFIDSVEKLILSGNGFNPDCAISRSLYLVNNSYCLKESIFLQKNFKSVLNGITVNSKLDFRYTRDQFISSNTKIDFKKKITRDFCYLNKFGDFESFYLTLNFMSLNERFEEFNLFVSDYNTGFYLFLYPNLNNGNFWVRGKIPMADNLVVELERCSDNRIVHREKLNMVDVLLEASF